MGANRTAAPAKKKPVLDPLYKYLKPWPEKMRRKRTVQLRSKCPHALYESLDKNSGWCIKKSVVGWDEVAKPLDDNDRKMRFSGDMDLASASQDFSESSGVKLNEGNEGSCNRKMIRCPYVNTLPNDSIIKQQGMNTCFKKHPKHLQMEGVTFVKEPPSKFVTWPESVQKKRSFSYHNQLAKTLENTLGLVWHGKHQKWGREKFGTMSTHSLPEEVVEEILSRLPVKSLSRFRCVCKSWHHLSYSKRFMSLHVKNYRTSQLLVGTCCVLRSRISSMYFLSPTPPPTGDYSDYGVSQNTVRHLSSELLGGSCNGIVCLYTDYADEYIVLWNPATAEFKNIRKSGFPRNRRLSLCTVGFGFDPKTDDYKILQMVYGKPNPPVARMELYSMRKDSWKKVDSHDFFVVRNISPADIACSLPFTDNRIVCAVVSPLNGGTSKWEILSFDMSSEMYEIIPVSPSLDAELGDHEYFQYRKRHFKLFPFKESIALGIVYRIGNGSYCDIWVLKGFNSSAQSRSWSKLLSTDINEGCTVPVGCWGSNQIIFQEKWSRRLFRLDHCSNTMVELGVVPSTSVVTTEYKESLVRINYMPEKDCSRN